MKVKTKIGNKQDVVKLLYDYIHPIEENTFTFLTFDDIDYFDDSKTFDNYRLIFTDPEHYIQKEYEKKEAFFTNDSFFSLFKYTCSGAPCTHKYYSLLAFKKTLEEMGFKVKNYHNHYLICEGKKVCGLMTKGTASKRYEIILGTFKINENYTISNTVKGLEDINPNFDRIEFKNKLIKNIQSF